jgi:hypothetical protein
MVTAPGCSAFRGLQEYLEYNEECEETILNWRDYNWSWQAWRFRKRMYRGQPQFFAFGEGFRAGYTNVASGGDGCPPALPPRKFWSYGFQSAEGQSKVAAWYAGFPEGVRAAREDGVGLYQDIQVAGSVNSMFSSGYQQGGCPTCGEIHLGPVEHVNPEMMDASPLEPMSESQVPIMPQTYTPMRLNTLSPQFDGISEPAQTGGGVRHVGYNDPVVTWPGAK